MSLSRVIYDKLNESEAVKKPYGDKPQDGKAAKLNNRKGKSIQKGKLGSYKVEKLNKVNPQANDVYTNDTDKLMDKIDSKEQSDRGKIAKTTGKKSEKTIKFPFGNKVQQSDSKLIKEGKESEGCKNKITEDYDNGTWMKYQYMIEGTLESAKEDMDEDAFQDFCEGVINIAENYLGILDQFESAKPDGDKCYGCGKVIKRNGVEIGGHMYHPSCGAFLDECGKACKKEVE